MKKIILTVCAFVLCVACGLGLTACSVGEVKENTSAVIETSTSIIPVEYSQGLATNLLQVALTNLNNCSYSYTSETRNLIGGELQSVEDAGGHNKLTFINDYGKTEMYGDYVDNGKVAMKVLKNADNQANYYYISSKTKRFYELGENLGNGSFSALLTKVTDGMCYNGISYIHCCQDIGVNQKHYTEVQIKDGLIKSIMYTYRDADTMKITSQSIFNFSYGNIERPMYLPDTVAALESMGYQLIESI